MAFVGKKILIAEDEIALAEAIKGWFEFIDEFKATKILMANTAEEAEGYLLEEEPDITILDLGLGDGLGGLEILKRMQKDLPSKCKIFVYSGYSEYKDACLLAGAVDFFDKTTPLADMIVKIQKCLSSK